MRTKKLVARIYGVTEQTLDHYQGQGMPWGNAQDGWDLLAIGDWRRLRRMRIDDEIRQNRDRLAQAQAAGDAEAIELFTQDWELRREAAEAQLAELKLDWERDLYASRDEVERVAAQTLTTLRQMLRAIPVKMALLVPERKHEARRDAAEVVRKTLETARIALGGAVDLDRAWTPDVAAEALDGILAAMPEMMVDAVSGARAKQRARKLMTQWTQMARRALREVR